MDDPGVDQAADRFWDGINRRWRHLSPWGRQVASALALGFPHVQPELWLFMTEYSYEMAGDAGGQCAAGAMLEAIFPTGGDHVG